MDTEHLRQFALLAKECHFQTAADLLYINQSTLSKHIAALEKELGQKLFHRTTRQVTLTEFGLDFLPYAEKIIGILNDCDAQLISKYKKNAPSFCVGVSPFVSVSKLMKGKIHCAEAAPEISSMIFTETDSVSLREGLKSGRFQMVIDGISPQWETDHISAVPYAQDHLCVLLRDDHPLAERDTLSPHELETIPYIHMYTETNTSPFLEEPILIADTAPQALGAVKEGVGYTILPYKRVKNHLPERVRAIPLTPSPALQFNAYYLRHVPRSEALSALLKFFIKDE